MYGDVGMVVIRRSGESKEMVKAGIGGEGEGEGEGEGILGCGFRRVVMKI